MGESKINKKQSFWGHSSIRLLPLLSSLITGLAFLSNHLPALVFVGLLPFIYYVNHLKGLSGKKILFDCWFAGLVFSLIIYGWTLQTAPDTWVAVHGGTSVAIKAITWLSLGLVSSVTGLIVGVIIARFKTESTKLLLILPFVWALAEVCRSYSLAALVLGPGSSISPNYNFGALGLAVAATPLVYISRFIGLWGLTVVAVAINLAIYYAFTKRFKSLAAIIITIASLNILAWRLYTPSNQSIKVAAVYLHSVDGTLNPWGQIALPAKDTAVLVLPEYSHFFQNPNYKQFAESNFGNKTIVVTTQAGQGVPPTNNLIYYSNQTGLISKQSKTFLAPYGEYLPYSSEALLKLFGQQLAINSFKVYEQVKNGNLPEHAVTANGLSVGGLACSGVINLNEYRRLAHQGADVLTNSASLSLLDTASLYQLQELYQNRLHAVSNAKPFVQSSRSGVSYVISSDGQILVRTYGRSELIETTVALQPKQTVYSWLP